MVADEDRADLTSWAPLSIDEVTTVFAGAPLRWWISGGHALDLHVGRSWRRHEDLDVGVVRGDAALLFAHLQDWEIHVAAAGRLTRWGGEPLDAARHQNNLWCRRNAHAPWSLDVTVGEGSADAWVYRRDPAVRAPWSEAVLWTADGIPYLAPELQLLYKSKGPREKDTIDAAEVIPMLESDRREVLGRLLDPEHPWHCLIR